MNNHLIITTIGSQGSGKTTVLCMLAGLLHEDGLTPKFGLPTKAQRIITKTHIVGDVGMLFTEIINNDKRVHLVECPDEDTAVLLKSLNTIFIRVRIKGVVEPPWMRDLDTDLFINNEDNFRKLKYYTEFLYGQIQELPKWKEVFGHIIKETTAQHE